MSRELENRSPSLLDGIPLACRERFAEIVDRLDHFCARHLNDEYRDICQLLVAYLCQENSPALRGKPEGWAAGVVYAAGRINFLTDPSQQPHMKADDIARGFGVSPATMYSKSRVLWDGLDLMPFDPEFTLPSRLEDNPLAWLIEINGFPVDIRDMPRELQAAACQQGLIPYIPADRPPTAPR